ncbi:MAG: hypothetical protein R8K22_08040, partial [Mariprofundaceae bacterium]
ASKRLEQAEVTRWNSVRDEGFTAMPIRKGHVVWGFVKLDGKFLFHRKTEHKSRTLGEFGPIGGKMNESDIPTSFDMAERIRMINSESLVDSTFEGFWFNAMTREIGNELAEDLMGDEGLEYGHDYILSVLEPALEPFSFCRGTDLIFSVAKYWFKMYQVELTLRGYLKLKAHLIVNKRLQLASVEEMEGEVTENGIKLDIKALHEHFPGGFSALADKLDTMKNSFSLSYKDEKGIIIPSSEGQPMEVCTTAKTVMAGMEILNQEEINLLLGLAAHARGWTLEGKPDGIELYCDGWVDVTDNEPIRQQLLQLVDKAPAYFDVDDSNYFRLSVLPEKILFHSSLFKFSVDVTGLNPTTPLHIIRQEINSSLGKLQAGSECINIDIEQAVNITNLYKKGAKGFSKDYCMSESNYTSRVEKEKEKQGKHWEDYTWGQWEKNFTRSVRDKLNPIGLRCLVRTELKVVSLVCDKTFVNLQG